MVVFHLVSNNTVRLLPGIHILNFEVGVIRVSNFTFVGYSDSTNDIHGISVNISNIHITCSPLTPFIAFRHFAEAIKGNLAIDGPSFQPKK